jgi:endonuclease/exonuclease/phosphatase family metal-dependent hydrolase
MQVISWNIQAGMGVDGRVDLARIAGVIRTLGDADVICLQEVARHLPVPGDADGGDQVAALAAHFPGHIPFFGAAIDRLGRGSARVRFGNLVLSRLPVLQCFRHPLPQPADPSTQHMPRQATEVVVETPAGCMCVITTHLEFHSRRQRLAQVRHLTDLDAQRREAERAPAAAAASGLYAAVPRPSSALLCGDFNFESRDPEYHALGAAGLVDAWSKLYPHTPHAPTCGIYDHVQWPGGAHCRDFFFCTPDLAARIESIAVDVETAASDHQPLLLRIGSG